MATMLPAQPALELGKTVTLKPAVSISASKGPQYTAPADYQSPDLADCGEPPAALGAFWTQPK